MASLTWLDEVLTAWQDARAGVIDEIENLSEANLTFKPHPESRTPADLVIHIVDTGLMMSGELTRADGSFRRKSFPQFMKEYGAGIKPSAKKAVLVRELKRTQKEGAQKIRAAGELWIMQMIVQFNSEPGSRLSWFNHGVAHEEYHRGQLALYARLVGRVPALTQRILGN